MKFIELTLINDKKVFINFAQVQSMKLYENNGTEIRLYDNCFCVKESIEEIKNVLRTQLTNI
jgi:uncharacterized protein YlzI (FlbEa/FlbD family)